MRQYRNAWPFLLLVAFALLASQSDIVAADNRFFWKDPERVRKVMALIPGHGVSMPSPEIFLRKWTEEQVARWDKANLKIDLENPYKSFITTNPTDQQITAFVPDHISPFAIVLEGKPDPEKAANALINYCPLCGVRGRLMVDPSNPYHATSSCCRQDFYERQEDYPPNYKFRPNSVARFQHLDDTVKEVPGYIFTDAQGVKWQLFFGTVIALERWHRVASITLDFLNNFRETGNPLYVHKLAVLLDKVADVYYSLPFSFKNELASDSAGKPLTRAAWEAIPRPVMYGSALGPSSNNCFGWNRRLPNFNRGWVFQARECIWVEPFARVRHHPAFKYYSQKKYGDPEALDRKIMSKLMRDLGLLFKSFKLESDYQDGSYADLMILAILLKDKFLFNFAAGHQECVLYNHHYQDGMNGEGAPNYMDMLRGYYNYMANSKGWFEFDPDFLKRNPFFKSASIQLKNLYTVRGLPLEFGDQHIYAFDGRFLTDTDQVRKREAIPSMNWPGYGIGILRVGGPGHLQEVFMTYDRVSLHGASDKLGIECWVDGVPVMREGGYANPWNSVPLDAVQPEAKSLKALPYPRPIFDIRPVPGNPFGAKHWVHGLMAHNTVAVNEFGTGTGGSDNEGMGELITFKGGEPRSEPGSRFQVLDVRDLYSFERYSAALSGGNGIKVKEARRTLLAIEGPDGRPYVVDIIRFEGGQRHTLYQSAWADRVAEQLPAVTAIEADMARYLEKLRGPNAGKLPLRSSYEEIKKVEVRREAPKSWELTWKTDYAAYAPRHPDGRRRTDHLPAGIGQVRLRLMGLGNDGQLGQTGKTTLLTAKGPWVAIIDQPLPDGRSAYGNVGFRDALDYLIESRTTTGAEPLKSVYLHILEGYREGEESAIKRVQWLPFSSGVQAPEGAFALKLDLAAGHTDTVLFQPQPAKVCFEDGFTTDAGYALMRRGAQGQVTEVHLVRGTTLEWGQFSVRTQGQFRGTVVDLIGDLTGTRQESALIIRPDEPWPAGKALAGRQMLIHTICNYDEGFTIEKVTKQADGLLRVDLAGHPPFSTGWYQVARLDPQQPNALKSNRQLWAGINTPYWWGAKAWFPELDKTFTIKRTRSDRETLEVVAGEKSLATEGVKIGDWFTIYAIEPGVRVSVPGDFSWRREVINGGPVVRHILRATGTVSLSIPDEKGDLWARVGDGDYKRIPVVKDAKLSTMKFTLDGEEMAGHVVVIIANKPIEYIPETHR